MRVIKAKHINKFINQVLLKINCDKFTAYSVSKSLTDASLRGIDSHGIRLLEHYLNSFINGRKNRKPKFKFNRNFPAFISMDADHASGITAGMKAINYASKYAKKYGICGISIFNSSHPGALSTITLEAIKHDLICIGVANADNLILSPGGKKSYFGTNPISIVAPREKKSPFCLDMATSSIPWNKLLILKKNNELLEDGIAADEKGNNTNDPNKAKTLISIGSYKGYVLASAIEMLCSIMTGMPFGKNIDKMFDAPINKKRKLAQFYILLRVDNVITKRQFINNLKKMSQEVRSEPAKRNHKVMMPNDIQEENKKVRLSKGIPIDSSFYKFINKLDEKYNIKFKYFDKN